MKNNRGLGFKLISSGPHKKCQRHALITRVCRWRVYIVFVLRFSFSFSFFVFVFVKVCLLRLRLVALVELVNNVEHGVGGEGVDPCLGEALGVEGALHVGKLMQEVVAHEFQCPCLVFAETAG